MILAIVGTRTFGSPKGLLYAQLIISHEVSDMHWDSFVTGDAPGVDSLVLDVCDLLDRECESFIPGSRRWEPDGYKARNIRVAEACDELLCIRDPESSTYGSGWTANHAESLGKPVTRVEIS